MVISLDQDSIQASDPETRGMIRFSNISIQACTGTALWDLYDSKRVPPPETALVAFLPPASQGYSSIDVLDPFPFATHPWSTNTGLPPPPTLSPPPTPPPPPAPRPQAAADFYAWQFEQAYGSSRRRALLQADSGAAPGGATREQAAARRGEIEALLPLWLQERLRQHRAEQPSRPRSLRDFEVAHPALARGQPTRMQSGETYFAVGMRAQSAQSIATGNAQAPAAPRRQAAPGRQLGTGPESAEQQGHLSAAAMHNGARARRNFQGSRSRNKEKS